MTLSSRPVLLVALGIPALLTIAGVGTILMLAPQAPEMVTMQWLPSTNEASRIASPYALLPLTGLGFIVGILGWLMVPSWNRRGTPRGARLGIAVTNGVAAACNAGAIALMLGQMGGEPSQSPPLVGLLVAAVVATLIGIASYFFLKVRHSLTHPTNRKVGKP